MTDVEPFVALPDGRSLAQALLARDTSPRAPELHAAFRRLRAKIDPIAVVFDIGVARDNEHIHTAAVRMVQRRLGYCADPPVAEMELKLERDGHWKAFEALAAQRAGATVARGLPAGDRRKQARVFPKIRVADVIDIEPSGISSGGLHLWSGSMTPAGASRSSSCQRVLTRAVDEHEFGATVSLQVRCKGPSQAMISFLVEIDVCGVSASVPMKLFHSVLGQAP